MDSALENNRWNQSTIRCDHPKRRGQRCRVKFPKSESACKSLSTQQMKSEWKLKYTQLNSQSQSTIFFLSLKSTAEKINKTPKTEFSLRLKFILWSEIKFSDCAFITTKKYKDKMYITYKTLTLLYKIWSTSVAVNNFKNLQDGWMMSGRLQ